MQQLRMTSGNGNNNGGAGRGTPSASRPFISAASAFLDAILNSILGQLIRLLSMSDCRWFMGGPAKPPPAFVFTGK